MRLLPIFLPLCFQGDFFPLFFMAQAYPFSFPFVAIFTSVCHNKSIQGKMVGCIFLESPQASSRPKLGQKLFLFKDDAHFSQSWEHDGKSGKWPFSPKVFSPQNGHCLDRKFRSFFRILDLFRNAILKENYTDFVQKYINIFSLWISECKISCLMEQHRMVVYHPFFLIITIRN